MNKPVTIRDDANAEVSLYQWSRTDAEDPGNASLAEALQRAGEASRRTGWNVKLKRSDLWSILPGLLIPITVVALHRVWPSAPPWTIWFILPMVMLPIVTITARRHLREHSHLFASTLLAYQRCASCGYLLEGAIASDTNLIRCPECDATWKADRVGTIKIDTQGTASKPLPFASDPFRQGSNIGYLKPWSVLGQWNRTASVIDAQQRSLPLIRRADLTERLATRKGQAIANSVMLDVRSATRSHTVLTTLGVGAILLLATWVLWNTIGSLAGNSSWLTALIVVLILSSAVPYWIAQLWRTYQGQAQHTAKPVAQVLVDNDICPACAGELDSDRRCTCGAQWPAIFQTD